jgi:hypothetical protein
MAGPDSALFAGKAQNMGRWPKLCFSSQRRAGDATAAGTAELIAGRFPDRSLDANQVGAF